MAIRTELSLRLPNSPGALVEVCRALAQEQVNVLAMALDASGRLRLVVDNRARATGALGGIGRQVTEREVLFVRVPHGPGALAPVLALIAEAGINVEYAYGAPGDPGLPGQAAIVLGVDDAMGAATAAGV